MAYTIPSVSDFKALFDTDFPYGTTVGTVTDGMISRAITEASFNMNSALAQDQGQYTMLYCYQAAHFLVLDIRAASQGWAGNYSWVTTSKNVGSVSESFSVPDRIMANPLWAQFSKTYYGAKFLNLIFAQLTGAMFTVPGRTQP